MIDRSGLLKDLQRELPKIEKDILVYSESKPKLADHLQEEYKKAQAAGRTAEHFLSWREAQITQAAVAWVLTCVFVRFLEDNNLLVEPMLSGPDSNEKGEKPLEHAKERMVAYFNEHPTLEERDYLLNLFSELERFPVIAELLDHRHNPLWQIPVSSDGARALIDFFQKIDADSGDIIHDFTDADWDTRFLGDLYQDLSESVRKRYALLQTPEFVESFILDYTLEKAKDTFGIPGLRLIDPTCGSGHFLLTTFERMFNAWQKREPGTNTRELAQRALDVVHGVDINPYAIAICRFRLFIAAMKAAGSHKIRNAPDFHFNLACGDSLLHGCRFEWQGQGQQTDLIDEDPIKHVLEVEDKDKLLKILGQQYHAVVGNPPYIVVRDKALNQAYRDRYLTCHRQYSLGVPFTERFFDLTLHEDGNLPAGYMGMITANSFMKREFGKKLIEEYLINKDVTHIIDTSGAYIPGHGTPTLILIGRNKKANNFNEINVAMGKRAEPKTPEIASEGMVWSSIVKLIKGGVGENDFIAVEKKRRNIYAFHPWSLTGGGAIELKGILDSKIDTTLKNEISDIGRTTHSGEDEVFYLPPKTINTLGLNKHSVPIVLGEDVRDWSLKANKLHTVFPYTIDGKTVANPLPETIFNYLWPYKSNLRKRQDFGQSIEDRGLLWYEHSMYFPIRYNQPVSISFPEVASHNHFVLDNGGKIFKQTAPAIKCSVEEGMDNVSYLLGYLNSSIICFYMKQTSHQKQLTGGDGIRIEFVSKVPYQFSGTSVKKLPVLSPEYHRDFFTRVVEIVNSIDKNVKLTDVLMPSLAIKEAILKGGSIEDVWNKYQKDKSTILSKQVIAQEELDWLCYVELDLCGAELLGDINNWREVDVKPGQRPFEILAQLNQDDFEVPSDVPSFWPDEVQKIWFARMNAIKHIREINVLETPHYKRRWIGRQGLFNKSAKSDSLQVACKEWMLDIIENQYLKHDEVLSTCGSLTDRLHNDKDFNKVAKHYSGNELFDMQTLVSNLIAFEHIPQFAGGRYKLGSMPKYRAWQETWEKQRQEDTIDAEFGVAQPLSEDDKADSDKLIAFEVAKAKSAAKKTEVVGEIPIPPKYAAGDFRKASYWPLRGKLDVPKERFFSMPNCEKDGDSTIVIGWAGMNHLQRATAIATWYLDRKETDGWEAEKLKPMLVALDELIPWLKQWYNEIDAEFGERMGDYYEGFLLEEMLMLNISKEDLLVWEPIASPKKKAEPKKRKVKTSKSINLNDIDTAKEQG